MDLSDVIELRLPGFSAEDTFFCGQCFRWRRADGGYDGVIGANRVFVRVCGDTLTAEGCGEEQLREYFDLGTDYTALQALFCRDETLRRAVSFAPGIRVLRQPLFEALVTFILSQNNNIPRIAGIVERFCGCFGEDAGGRRAFPTPCALSGIAEQDLAPLRCGFRAGYLADAFGYFCRGEIDEQALRRLPLDEARAQLMRIRGVGPKVADCALLFGAGRHDAFPQDVWVRRMMQTFYPRGLPDDILPYAGIAQQYLFHYARSSGFFAAAKGARS
ncbi:MAG: DNA glycosylase [Oscillospiraceae bacterium]|nr:DNA glycosylase [Oscillospiraceae bacterium]